jgi:hypothetical protein
LILGDFFDHSAGDVVEAGAAGVADGDVEGAEDEFGAFDVDGVAGEGVDDFHEGDLDGLLALDLGDGMETGVGRSADATDHALVEVAELLSAKSGRAATDSGDFDVRTTSYIGMNGHRDTFRNLISIR